MSPLRILIVDDTPANLVLMKGLLNKVEETFEVFTFEDPLMGFAWCAENVPDLLIVDYMMSEMDGIEFITGLRSVPVMAEVPILMVTADHERETRYRALESGASDFLNKPIDGPEFRARVRNMLALRRSQKALADRAAWLEDEVAKRTDWIYEREREMIMRLSRAAEFRDPETGAHIQRMSNYSMLIAEALGLPRDEQKLILKTAPMHDVGKIAIPDRILLKPGRLDADELVIMRGHAEAGYQILADSPSELLQVAAVIARSHHEKFDGSGYPQGLVGEAIPLHGRIVAVADVFDALTTERPYKKPWSIEDALRFLREGAGSHFDPACVHAFIDRLDDALAIRERYQDEKASLAHL